MPPISLLIKPSSGMCNLNCEYCFYRDITHNREQDSYGFMTETTLENVVKNAMEFAEGECNFAFQGGEPTLAGLPFFKKLMELEKKYSKDKVTIHNSLQTNGYLLDEQWCEFFSKHNFLIGLSIDGVQDTHDVFRKHPNGKGTYQDILKTVQLFRQYDVQYNVLTVVHKKSALQIRKIYINYAKKGFSYQQYIPCMDPYKKERGEEVYSLTPLAYGKFLTELFTLWYSDWKMGKQPYIRQFENYIGILLGYHPESCEQRGQCSFQNVIEADGSVYPCDFYVLDSYRLGNLNTESFAELYSKPGAGLFIEESYQVPEKCKKCPYYILCKGGCKRQRVWEEPSKIDTGSYFCESYQFFFDNCMVPLKEVAAKAATRVQ